MKNTFLLFCIGWATFCQAQQTETIFPIHSRDSFITVYMTGSIGMGLSGQPSVLSGAPFMGLMTLPLRFRSNLFLIPEAYGGAFRSPKFPDRRGLLIPVYPRYRHQLYGVRFGRSFAPPNNGFSVLPSIGINYLRIDEPYIDKPGGGLPNTILTTFTPFRFRLTCVFRTDAIVTQLLSLACGSTRTIVARSEVLRRARSSN